MTFLLLVANAALLAVAGGGAVYFMSTAPVGFQMLMSLKAAELPEPDWTTTPRPIDIASVIAAIPYSGSEGIAAVLPSVMYERTILDGGGNCANKCRGMAYYLEQRGLPFERVDLLMLDGFLLGKGHTILRGVILHEGEARPALIDMLEGGLPVRAGVPIDLPELLGAPPFTIEILPLNWRADRYSEYYGGFLESVVVARTPDEEIAAFFRFLEDVYVPLGAERFERIVYNAWAILRGKFPSRYVAKADYDRLLKGNEWKLTLAQSMVRAANLLLWTLPAAAVWLVARFIQKRLDRPRGAGEPAPSIA